MPGREIDIAARVDEMEREVGALEAEIDALERAVDGLGGPPSTSHATARAEIARLRQQSCALKGELAGLLELVRTRALAHMPASSTIH